MPDTQTSANRSRGKSVRKEEKQERTAFIAAAEAVDTSVLRQALRQNQITSFTLNESALPGSSLAESLVEAISKADLVVAVLDSDARNDRVLFELGLARGLQKPSLLLVSPGYDPALIAKTGIPSLRIRSDNAAAIEFGLSLFLRAPHPRVRPSKKKTPARPAGTQPLGDFADVLLGRLRKDLDHPEQVLQEVITKALQHTGVSAMSAPQVSDDGIDLAVWADDLEPLISNPLVIQLKASLSTTAEINQSIGHLWRTVSASPYCWALVIYLKGTQELSANPCPAPQVLFISAEEFLTRLKTTGFGELIRTLRGSRLHGVREHAEVLLEVRPSADSDTPARRKVRQ